VLSAGVAVANHRHRQRRQQTPGGEPLCESEAKRDGEIAGNGDCRTGDAEDGETASEDVPAANPVRQRADHRREENPRQCVQRDEQASCGLCDTERCSDCRQHRTDQRHVQRRHERHREDGDQ